jgi:O-antigen ligase
MAVITTLGLIGVVIYGAYYFGMQVGRGNIEQIQDLAVIVFGGIACLIILKEPVIGLSLVISGLLIQNELLGIRLIASLFTTIGFVTLIAYLITRKDRIFFKRLLNPPLLAMAGFVIWQLVSNPEASFHGTRPWILTYLQLFMLAVLAAELFDLKRVRLTMWMFMLACLPSAIQAFSGAEIVGNISSSDLVRSSGFQGNQNTLAFYLCIAMIFTLTLHALTKDRRLHLICFGLYALYIMGIVGTVSRAGFVLLAAVFIMTPLLRRWASPPPQNMSEDMRKKRRRVMNIGFAAIFALGMITFIVPDTYWEYLNNNLFQAETLDSGTQRRLELADLALEAWTGSPIIGVGVGNFTYLSGEELGKEQSSHNMYLSILAETGIIGFVLFVGWILLAMRELYLTARARQGEFSIFAAMWLTVLILVLLRGPTASTLHYDKLVWMVGGVSVAMSLKYLPQTIAPPAKVASPIRQRAARIAPDAQIIITEP